MQIVWTILVGFFVGLVARALVPGRDAAGFMVTTGLGIAGAILGSALGRILGLYAPGEATGLVMAIIGAVALLALYKKFFLKTGTVAR